MAVDTVSLLRELDVSIAAGSMAGTWVLRLPDGSRVEVQPAPGRGSVDSRVRRNAAVHRNAGSRLLLVGRSATSAVLESAKAGEIDVLTAEPIRLILGGRVHELPGPQRSEFVERRPGRPAWIRWAVERCLLLTDQPLRQREIADVLGTSQQAVSLAARHLGPLAAMDDEGLRAADPRALLDRWLGEYGGTNGQEFGWYSVDPIGAQAAVAVRTAAASDADPLVSGDAAADLIAPWKLPALGRVYVREPVDLVGHGFAPAPLGEASLITCVPQDPTLWRLARWHVQRFGQVTLPLADPLVVLWDLRNGRDVDSDQAAEKIADLVLGDAR